MIVETSSIDSVTGELTIEEWDLPAFNPEALCHAFKERSIELNGHSPAHTVVCQSWYPVTGIYAGFIIREYRSGILAVVVTGFAGVVQ